MGIERWLAADEHTPGLGYIRPVLLGRVQGLFFTRQVLGGKKPVNRTHSDGDRARGRKRAADLLQGRVGLPSDQL